MAGEQVRSDFVEGMKKTGYDYYYERHDQHPAVHPLIFKEHELTAAWEEWTTVVEENMPEEKTSELQDAPVAATVEGFKILMKARTYHRRKVWSKETVRDHQKLENLVKEATGNWGNGVFLRKETFYASFFNRGGITAGDDTIFDQSISGNVTDDSGDGVYDGTAASVMPFFNLASNTRTSKAGATYYNSITGGLNEANLESALILLEYTNAYSERDLQMQQIADTLLFPQHLESAALKLLKSEQEPGTNTNAINPFANRLRPIKWRFLTDTDAWFVGIAKEGVVMGTRQDPEINMFIDQRNGAFEAVIDLRFGGTVENWRPWVASNVSTS